MTSHDNVTDIERIIWRIGLRSHNAADLDRLVEAVPALLTELATLRKQLENAREALVEERETNLWNAYNAGHEKDGEWTHMCMSDGEWLAQQCGLDPKAQYYNAADVKALIPNAARKALKGQP